VRSVSRICARLSICDIYYR